MWKNYLIANQISALCSAVFHKLNRATLISSLCFAIFHKLNRAALVLFCVLILTSCAGGNLSKSQKLWKILPIQNQGRVKPFDTFSREVLRKVYGKENYKGSQAVEVILSWLVIPDFWENTKLILIEHKSIKSSLALPLKSRRFTPSELKNNQKLALQLVELKSIKQREERLDSYFQRLEKLEIQLLLYESVKSGWLLRFFPQKDSTSWLSLSEVKGQAEQQFKKLLSLYIRLLGQKFQTATLGNDLNKKAEATNEELFLTFTKEVELFQTTLFRGVKQITFQNSRLKAEVFYNSFKPFLWAGFFYFCFLLFTILVYILKRETLLKCFIPFVGVGFLSHSLGILLRSYIMSRPPVSNMYETVIWVPWVALISGFVFYFKGSKLTFIASVILACFSLFLINLAPDILDRSLQPLEAVLRSSFWLSTHVLIITMSYSFFFLAFVLGDMALVSYLVNKSKPLFLINKMYKPIYHSIQWGVILLAIGTILGAIWADYSWGRFWAWDPKESWALVSLLAYLALLHGKLVGWIQPIGLAISSVLMFFLVIMAWYGVNFVLGVGLHSYGFGSGGIGYMFGFLCLHLILCALVGFKKIQGKSVSNP